MLIFTSTKKKDLKYIHKLNCNHHLFHKRKYNILLYKWQMNRFIIFVLVCPLEADSRSRGNSFSVILILVMHYYSSLRI